MSRISRHHMFMKMATDASERSTCYRRSVGAILVLPHNNVISVAYNGPPAGEPHCTGANCPGPAGCSRAVHAEYNAITRACVSPALATLYTTESPCPECAELLITSKIKRIFYQHEYRIRDGLDRLVAAGVEVYRLTPGGYIIDYVTNELVKDV